ncbi:putative N6-adenosine-methyltransferase MT-A70-like [Apostasia shenzhenica]|uniref:Putative N6-adenosine-methyltransferase MT-A70-like n=1 Tax=Apostasia shenzhenica TaxID=1088818 RepID=A0A2I0A961_9ASPA|nr:putative N6-adenosine-methyltransferase MT-A70-like [Apostasia shenzhenica]
MEPQIDGRTAATGVTGGDDVGILKEMRLQLQDFIEARRITQLDLLSSLQTLVPDIFSSLDVSLRLISTFTGRSFSVLPNPNPNPNRIAISSSFPNSKVHSESRRRPLPSSTSLPRTRRKTSPTPLHPSRDRLYVDNEAGSGGGDRLSVVRTMVAVCLLELVPFTEIDSAALLRRLESDQSSATPAEKAAMVELGGELGTISAVETALRRIAEDSGGVQLEDFTLNGKSMLMVWAIDRSKLLKELPESSQQQQALPLESASAEGNNQTQAAILPSADRNSAIMPRPSHDLWMGHPDPHLAGMPPMFPGAGAPAPLVGPRGGPRMMGIMGIPRVMGGVPPLHRPLMGPGTAMGCPSPAPAKPRTEEDDRKDIEALLNKKTFREMQKSKTGEELLDLIHRPTARETAVAAKFKTKGGSQLKEYCTHLTKEDCRRHSGSFIACVKVHFRRIIAPHTDTNLGDCSFLDTCRHTKTCKYVHYELDQTPDMPSMMMGNANLPPPRPMKTQRAEYCSEVELGEPQWINCDIRTFRMDILGQFGVIMADPPWDIHMELPYGTMADDEMRTLNVPALQTDGLIFLWVTGRAMELGRECLDLWGYKRVEEIIWVKTNQLQRIIRTGRTGHWLNHSKEHCLVGIKGNPEVNRNIDTDVIVAEVRETSRKPDEMYPMLERISPRTRKLELFARMHNTHAGWLSLGNQLNGVRLVDEGLRARFKAAYPDVEVHPPSPPRRAPSADPESSNLQVKSPFFASNSKQPVEQYMEATAPQAYPSEGNPVAVEAENAV